MRITIVDAKREFRSIELDPAVEYTLGRSRDCAVPLDTNLASRLHARIAMEAGDWTLTDNDSTNGTLLNGKKILRARLANYDVIRIGDVIVEVHDDALLQTLKFGKDEGDAKVVAEQVGNLRDIFLAFKRGVTGENLPVELALFEKSLAHGLREFARQATRATRELRVLLELTRSISEIFNLKELLNLALDLVNELRQVERGLVLLYDARVEEFLPYVSRRMSAADLDTATDRVSRAILDEARRSESVVLIADTLRDERFLSAESVVALAGKSILCVPLVSKRGLQGVFYLERGVDAPFTEEDAAFMRTFAGSVSVALDNAKLMAAVRREKNIRNNMERYISPNLIDQLEKAKGGLKLDGEKREVTLLFIDIKNFTAISERLAVEDVFAMLNRVFTGVAEIIFRHDGTLDKFMGDCVMAFFGAPAAHPDDPERAVATCVESIAFVRELAAEMKAAFGIDLGVSIGVNTGDAIVGNIGSLERMEYTAIGDTVNLAARLQAAAGFNEIVVNETTYARVGHRFPGEPIGSFKVKGKEHEVRAFRIKG